MYEEMFKAIAIKNFLLGVMQVWGVFHSILYDCLYFHNRQKILCYYKSLLFKFRQRKHIFRKCIHRAWLLFFPEVLKLSSCIKPNHRIVYRGLILSIVV